MIYPKANQPRLKLLKHTRTYILIMPRGNRKASLSTRLAAIPKRGIVPQAEIPGSEEWSRLRAPAKPEQLLRMRYSLIISTDGLMEMGGSTSKAVNMMVHGLIHNTQIESSREIQ